MLPFPLKYRPCSLADIQGQDKSLSFLQDYLKNYPRQKKKAAFIYGPIGCGKTCAIYALAHQLNYEIIEVNSSDLRNEEALNQIVGQALKQRSLFFRNKLILIDEVDNLSGRYDRGATQTLIKLLQDSTYPVILTANDPFGKALSSLRKSSEMVEFSPLSYLTIAHFLKEICRQENIQYEEKALNTLARMADGDLRGALIDLQLLASDHILTQEKLAHLSDRQKTESIFNALRLIFKATDIQNSLPVLDNLNLPLNELFLWLDENLPKEYQKPEDLYQAYQKLSQADIFNGRIRKQQHWRFLVYINNYLTAGISSSKSQKNPNFINYTPTTRILKLWQAKMKNAKKKDLAQKLAQKTHTSQTQAFQALPYFQRIFKNSPGQFLFIQQFDLSQEEVEWLNN